jgi:GMP synthase-like glutamine amidotransferase
MENLKELLTALIDQTKPYVVVGAICFGAGLLIGALV